MNSQAIKLIISLFILSAFSMPLHARVSNGSKTLLLADTTVNAGSITIDGIYDPSDNWQKTFNIDFTLDRQNANGSFQHGLGFLALGTSTGTDGNNHTVLYYSLPKQFVDITYDEDGAANGEHRYGWNNNRNTIKKHTYKSLERSDYLKFSLVGERSTKHKLYGDISSGIISASATSLQYDKYLIENKPSSEYSYLHSPDLGNDNTDDSDVVYDAYTGDWIFDVAYEIEFSTDLLAGLDTNKEWGIDELKDIFKYTTFSNRDRLQDGSKADYKTFFGGHASPSKVAIRGEEFQDCISVTAFNSGKCSATGGGGNSNAIPTSGTIWLIMIGLAGLLKARFKS